MKNEIYDNMLSAYDLSTEQKRRNAIFEVNQQVDPCRTAQRRILRCGIILWGHLSENFPWTSAVLGRYGFLSSVSRSMKFLTGNRSFFN